MTAFRKTDLNNRNVLCFFLKGVPESWYNFQNCTKQRDLPEGGSVERMKILVIDAQGGGIGKQAVSAIREAFPDAEIIAVGTNTTATSAMLRAGADHAATGENAVVVCSRDADIIIGPIGIVIADSMYGEITPRMASAVGSSRARRILIPIRHCANTVVGVANYQIGTLIKEAVQEIRNDNAARQGIDSIASGIVERSCQRLKTD